MTRLPTGFSYGLPVLFVLIMTAGLASMLGATPSAGHARGRVSDAHVRAGVERGAERSREEAPATTACTRWPRRRPATCGPWGITPTRATSTRRWSSVGTAHSGPSCASEGTLQGVAVVAANDVWAVGYKGRDPGPYETLAMHWDGTQWAIVPTPNPGAGGQLLAVSAVAANDVWAVRHYQIRISPRTLTLHWDGTQWTQADSPHTGSGSELAGVAAVASNDVWAVGGYFDTSRVYRPLIEHWDGTQWSIVTSPQVNGYLWAPMLSRQPTPGPWAT